MIQIAQYIPFTEEQKTRAATVDLAAFLQSQGEKLIRSGREKRMVSDHSVTIKGSEWYDHAAQRGGNAISFVQKFFHMSFPDAMRVLLEEDYPLIEPSGKEIKPFALPEASADMHRVFAYLTETRGISGEIVSAFAHEGLIYEDTKYHNVVFVGKDEHGAARHAHVRSTNTKGRTFRINIEGSDAAYSFHRIGTNGNLCVFEAPIDLLSYISLYPQNWQENSYVACCGTSIQPVLKTMEQMPSIENVLLCLDNDLAGREASERMKAMLEERGITVVQQIPQLKDWNDVLVAVQKQDIQLAGP